MRRNKILVVDDEPNIRNACAVAFKMEGYQVAEAETGEQAAQMIKQTNYNIVLLDIRLPDSDGIRILKWLKANSPKNDVIMMTAHPTVDSAVEALRQGAYNYIVKPFSVTELILLVKQCLEQQQIKHKRDELMDGMTQFKQSLNIIKTKAQDIRQDIKNDRFDSGDISERARDIVNQVDKMTETIGNMYPTTVR